MAIAWSGSTDIAVQAGHQASGTWFAVYGAAAPYTWYPVLSWAYIRKTSGEIAFVGTIRNTATGDYAIAPLLANFKGYYMIGETIP